MKIHTEILKKRLNKAVKPGWEIIDGLKGIFNQAEKRDKASKLDHCAKHRALWFLSFDSRHRVNII